jgi:hypothetical protein
MPTSAARAEIRRPIGLRLDCSLWSDARRGFLYCDFKSAGCAGARRRLARRAGGRVEPTGVGRAEPAPRYRIGTACAAEEVRAVAIGLFAPSDAHQRTVTS